MTELSIDPKAVAIVGATGIGKTTLGTAVQKRVERSGDQPVFYPEPNPKLHLKFPEYCAAMTQDGPNQFALAFQKWMATSAFDDGRDMRARRETNDDSFFIAELGPFGHFMYAFKLYREGKLDVASFSKYCQFFFTELVTSTVPQTMLVCTVASVDTLLERIKQRAEKHPERQPEVENYTPEYLDPMLQYWRFLLDHGTVLPLKEMIDIADQSEVPEININGKAYPLLSLEELTQLVPALATVLTPASLHQLNQIQMIEMRADQTNWSLTKKKPKRVAALREKADRKGKALPGHRKLKFEDPAAKEMIDTVLLNTHPAAV